MPDGWPCWAVSNHDVQRVATRWGGSHSHPRLAAQLVALVASLRGSVCLYQGEELGLPEAEVPYEQLQDPYGIAFWPNFKGRDGCRTPMPWQAGGDAGFGSDAPWLPVAEPHRAMSVAQQEADPESTLHAARAFLRWRKQHPALVGGDIAFIDVPEPALAFWRRGDDQSLCVVFNLSDEPLDIALPEAGGLQPVQVPGFPQGGEQVGGGLRLAPRGVFFGAA